jgi:hypothetical protein
MGSKPTGISASRGAAVLGLSPWSTPLEAWSKIMEERQPGFCLAHGIVPPEPPDNAAIRWGNAFEDSVIELAELERKQPIGAREAFFEVAGDTPITCHVDGIYGSKIGPARKDAPLHEGKTTSIFAFREKWGEPGSDRIPQEYAVQVQHQMICTGAKSAVVSVLVFPKRVEEFEAVGCEATSRDTWRPITWAVILKEMGYFHQYEIQANPSTQAEMIEAYRAFWHDNVLNETPPNPENWKDILSLYPEPKGTVIASPEQVRLATEYGQLTKEIGEAKKQQDILKTKIMQEIKRGASHPIDDDSVEAIVLRDNSGRKLASLAKGKRGVMFRCNG